MGGIVVPQAHPADESAVRFMNCRALLFIGIHSSVNRWVNRKKEALCMHLEQGYLCYSKLDWNRDYSPASSWHYYSDAAAIMDAVVSIEARYGPTILW
jgi:hypothetical protein